jgi:hypothetical protein
MRWRFLVAALAAALGNGCHQSEPSAQPVICPDPVAGCRFDLGGERMALRFSESPRALRPFAMEVDATRAVAVMADFTMSGMDMLPNRYALARGADGHWRATVVLPVCISGRADWHLVLTVGNERASLPFSAGP